MASCFPNSNNQTDATPMLFSRDSLSSSYSQTPVLSSNTTMYPNYSSSTAYPDPLTGNAQQQNSCINIISVGPSEFGTWKDRNEMLLMQPISNASVVLQDGRNLHGQGLSLSLGTEIPSGIQDSNLSFSSLLSPNLSTFGSGSGVNGPFGDNSESMNEDVSCFGVSNVSRIVPRSKYLKAAQKLLDEVVNIRKARKGSQEVDEGSNSEHMLAFGTAARLNSHETNINFPSELSATEKQELQNKVTKLLSMFDEVDRRYKQYYHQTQIVESSFDVIAGCGAAKPYTTLAFHTISCQFRSLRDAIAGHIQATRRSLSEEDPSSNCKGIGISRLRHVDQQLGQHKAISELHLTHHAWRPQRGLPENSVSILRAWLFEHFLNPYPRDSDKILLARQTGLTRSQVSNWFINARVRLWKPMVEEMYKEETGNAELDSNSSSELAAKATKGDVKTPKDTPKDTGEDLQQSATSAATRLCSAYFLSSKPNRVSDAEMAGMSANANFQDGTRGETETKYNSAGSRAEQHSGARNNSFFLDAVVQSSTGCERFMEAANSYHVSELDSFGSGDRVSLTLGLQNEGVSLPLSVGAHHGFVTMRGDEIYNAGGSPLGSETADFECMHSGNRQLRCGSSHLLHDFVA